MTADGSPISPYAWRTRFALERLGLDFAGVGLSFTDIRQVFSGRFTTVPILEDGAAVVGDSWSIADYLDAQHGPGALFGSPGERAMVRFFDRWCARNITPALFQICVIDIHDRLGAQDRVYFRESREERLGKPLEETLATREGQRAQLRLALQLIRDVLKESAFIGGEAANYADFIGWGLFIWAGSVSSVPLLEPGDPLLDWLRRGIASQRRADLHLPGLGISAR